MVEVVNRTGINPGFSVLVEAVETRSGTKPDRDGVVVLRVVKR